MRFLLALFCLLPLNAAHAGWVLDWCALQVGFMETSRPQFPATSMSHEKASSILGTGTPARRSRLALDYLRRNRDSYSSQAQMAADLNFMFEIISAESKMNETQWTFDAVKGVEDTIVFVGSAGHFTLITADRKLFKGFATKEDFTSEGEWKGDVKKLKPVEEFKPLSTVAVQTMLKDLANAQAQSTAAMNYVSRQLYPSKTEMLTDLKMLFNYIHGATPQWTAEKFYGPENAEGFVGTNGHFVLVKGNGAILKGKLDPLTDIDERGVWKGRASKIETVEMQ